MRREDWREEEADRLRRLRDRDRAEADREDYGQADYSNLYGYDSRNRTGYRAYDDGRREPPSVGPYAERPYYDERDRRDVERHERDTRRARRDGPSDRVLWAVIMERLEDERRLDLSEVDLDVRDGEVFLNGTVRHKADKRRIEDVADIDGVRNVQNNLRLRERRRWTFL
ncbi:MAG: BON domain-containing protein [Pseudomonadota bacterium]